MSDGTQPHQDTYLDQSWVRDGVSCGGHVGGERSARDVLDSSKPRKNTSRVHVVYMNERTQELPTIGQGGPFMLSVSISWEREVHTQCDHTANG